jgi:hypoxanthine phosphoribosyltransferase
MSRIEQYISSPDIWSRVKELGRVIHEYYDEHQLVSEQNPLMVLVILKGSTIFFSDLVRELNLPLTVEFISISSYGNDTESSGEVRFELDTRQSMTGRHVLVVEDIIDTGNSLNAVLNLFKSRNPASIEIVCLLDKQSRRKTWVDVHWTGFKIEDKFVIGYGLDYGERYRELPYIGVLHQSE